MRKTIIAMAVAGLVGLTGAMTVGCASGSPTTSSRPAAASLPDGLTVLEARPEWGTRAAFKQAGHVVYLETRVGPTKPAMYLKEFPNDPRSEMDARIVDENGFTFVLVIGGDKLIDASWGADIAAGEAAHPTDPVTTEMFFKLGRDAGLAFASQAAPELKDHVFHLTNATKYVPSEHPDDVARRSQMIRESIDKGVITKLDSVYGHYLQGQNNNECLYGCVAYHTAVTGFDGFYDFTSNTWSSYSYIYSCNHGPCSNTLGSDGVYAYSGMTTYGGWYNSPYSLAQIWSAEPSGSNSTYTEGHGCQTGYNWDTPPGHECNDDSAYENWQINDSLEESGGWGATRYGNQSTFNWGDGLCEGIGCGFLGLGCCAASYSCSCGTYSGCHGDWGSPPAP